MAERQRTEHLEQLEERVNRRVRETIDELRTQVRERLRRAAEQIGEVAEGLGETDAALPESFLPREDLASWNEEVEAEGRLGGELVEALAAVDRASGQSELLEALAAEAGRFASRTAVLVAREGSAELWSSHGWDGGSGSTVVEYSEDGAWSPDRFGRGVQALGPGACGELCGRLDAPLPAEGVLVPLVLRDRVAALVYADRAEDGPPLRREALQVLTYAAALALETLPFRERSATATLATGDGLAEPAPLWSAAAPPSPAEADVLPAPDEELGDGAEEAAAEVPDADLSDAGLAPDDHGIGGYESGGYTDAAAGGWQLDEGAEAAVEAPQGFEPAEPPAAEPPLWEATAPEEIEVEPEHQDEEEYAAVEADEDTADVPVAEEAETGEERGWARPEPWEAAGEEPAAEEPEQEPEPEPEAEAEPMGDADEEREGAYEQPEPYGAAEQAPATPAADDGSGGSSAEVAPGLPSAPVVGSVEVQPPSDVEGPGRAFAGGRAPEGDPLHEEARRLARLLVSEIRLYNEEEVEAGRRTGDVYERLKEDIDRSRQMYEDRVDPEVRESTDYFYQELVRNLGGGDAKALGI